MDYYELYECGVAGYSFQFSYIPARPEAAPRTCDCIEGNKTIFLLIHIIFIQTLTWDERQSSQHSCV